jgi:catecholate siderophore receptor
VASVANPSRLDLMMSTRGGIIYQPTASSSYYVSYGNSLNPSAEAISQSTTANSAALDPEKNRSYEAGAKWDLMDGNVALTTAVFRVEKTNARTTDPLTSIVSLAGNVRVNGFETGIVGRISPVWQVIAGYTFLDGKIAKSNDIGTGADLGLRAEGKTYPNTPRNTATLWSTYRLAPAWEAGGGLVYSSERFLNNFETAVTDAYTRFDATLAYRQPKYDIRLNLLNLTNKSYFETASGGRATPVEGRKVLLSMTYRF